MDHNWECTELWVVINHATDVYWFRPDSLWHPRGASSPTRVQTLVQLGIWRCFVLGYMCQGRFSVKESQWAGHVTSARLISKDFHLRQHIFHNQHSFNWCSFLILEPTLNPDTHTDTHCPLTMLNLACHQLFFEGHLTEIDVSWGKTADCSLTRQQHFPYVKRR